MDKNAENTFPTKPLKLPYSDALNHPKTFDKIHGNDFLYHRAIRMSTAEHYLAPSESRKSKDS
jgi:hypothetical protein